MLVLPLLNYNCSISSVQLLSHVQLFATTQNVARQASLSITNSQSLLKLMSIELLMPSNHLIFCHPLLLLPSIFPSIRGFSNESVLHLRWPKCWSFSFRVYKLKFGRWKSLPPHDSLWHHLHPTCLFSSVTQ